MMTRKRLLALISIVLIAGMLSPAGFAWGQGGDTPLTQTIYSVDGRYSLAYPEGWDAQGTDFMIRLATSSDVLEGGDLGEGQARVVVIVVPITDPPLSLPSDATLTDVLDLLAEIAPSASTCDPISEAVSTTVGSYPALYTTQVCSHTENITIAADLGDGQVAILAGSTGVSGIDSLSPTLMNIVASIQIEETTLPTGEEVFSSPDGDYTLVVPSGWTLTVEDVQGTRLVVLMPSDSQFEFAAPQPGSPFAVFMRGSVSEMTNSAPSLDDPANNPVSVLETLNSTTENEFGEVTPLTIKNRYAARTDAIYDTFEDAALVLMINEDAYMYANAFAAPGELDDFLKVVSDTLASASLRGEGLEAAAYIGDITLSQTYTAPDNSFAFDYPDGWTTDYDESLLVLSGTVRSEGDTRILPALVTQSGAAPEDLLRSGLETLGNGMISDGIIHFTVNGRPAARINSRNTVVSGLNLTQIAVDLDGEHFLVMMIGLAPFGDPDFETTLLAILASARVP